MMEQAKFTYSPLGKVFEKQTKTIEKQEKKSLKPNVQQLSIRNAVPED